MARRNATFEVEGIEAVLRHVSPDEVPVSRDLVGIDELPGYLSGRGEPAYSLAVVGDIMLAGRADTPIAEHGSDYPFQGVLPLLRRAPVVLGNLEGPFAPDGWKLPRNHSYAVPPRRAAALARAGINVLHAANNHLMDCGRRGILETLAAVRDAGLSSLGAGPNEASARAPVIREIAGCQVGLLGYYWNHRCAAIGARPGSAMDTPEFLEADVRQLRAQVDRVVVSFHWGLPYQRQPLPEDRVKARFAIDCGADLVIGHHPHVLQPFEIYRGRAIFYSVGNFAFGSGNSRAEGLLLGIRFAESKVTTIDVFPLYVKNRDPRVAYQAKLMRGASAQRVLSLLATLSGPSGAALDIRSGWGRLRVA